MRRIASSVCIALLCVVASWTCAFGLPPVQRTVLDNGLVLLVSEEHSLPFVTVNLMVKTGAKDDPPLGAGLADLTASSLLLGAAGRTLKQINEELDFMGVTVTASANKDYTTVSLRVLKKDLERAFPIFMDVVTKPTFPADEVKKEVSRTLAAIQSLEDKPGTVADRAFQKALYLDGPYGHPTEGTVESVSKLTREAIRRFHDLHYCPDNAILSVVGDIDQRSIDGYMAPWLKKWPKGGIPEKRIEIKFSTRKETIKVNKPVTQSNIVIGNGGMSRDNPDYYAGQVMNHIRAPAASRRALWRTSGTGRGWLTLWPVPLRRGNIRGPSWSFSRQRTARRPRQSRRPWKIWSGCAASLSQKKSWRTPRSTSSGIFLKGLAPSRGSPHFSRRSNTTASVSITRRNILLLSTASQGRTCSG